MNLRQYLKGSLFVELLVVCALIALFLPFLVTALARMQERQLLAQTYQDQHIIKNAIRSHIKAQWARLLPASCRIDERLFLTIESGDVPPARLAAREVSKGSDWLKGVDYGLCRRSIMLDDNPIETTMDCHWKAGDKASFSSCESYYDGQVLNVTTRKSVIDFGVDVALGQSGIIESQDAFYWYVSTGKEGVNALWRTPEESGNSLELWNGIERIAVYPLLDSSGNGLVDTLETRHGEFSLTSIKGLWVEYQYQLSDCKMSGKTAFQQEYHSMRDEVWRYLSPCQGVGNQIIVL
ncbi:hypothetical protein DFP75_102207 [Marinomonas alcarazii]|uniref:Uncharacterized protein n=1 Tax=Marinomonas alcarazii TaxID=491949 RepID=A0A318V604_9GAMM|nr:hypothetical protein [Marinomonas alcarazii]PYF83117.1 hypothetical protein DFP75_102207 [Marinomonas alcarazii]